MDVEIKPQASWRKEGVALIAISSSTGSACSRRWGLPLASAESDQAAQDGGSHGDARGQMVRRVRRWRSPRWARAASGHAPSPTAAGPRAGPRGDRLSPRRTGRAPPPSSVRSPSGSRGQTLRLPAGAPEPPPHPPALLRAPWPSRYPPNHILFRDAPGRPHRECFPPPCPAPFLLCRPRATTRVSEAQDDT